MTQTEVTPPPASKHAPPWVRWAALAALAVALEIMLRAIQDGLRFYDLLQPKADSESDLAVFALTLVGTSAVEMLASMVILLGAAVTFTKHVRLPLKRALNLSLIESVRALSAIILRVPFFVVPAVFEWLRMIPIPFVVLFDSAYSRGEIDALAASRRFFHQHKARVALAVLLLIIPTLLDWLLSQSNTDSLPIWERSAALHQTASTAALGITKLTVDALLILLFVHPLATPNTNQNLSSNDSVD